MDGDDDLTPIPFSQLPLKERVAKSQSWDKPNRQACKYVRDSFELTDGLRLSVVVKCYNLD